jgi:hypothetical protein
VWVVLDDEPGTSWQAAMVAFSRAVAICSSSSRRVRVARARRHAATAFSSASSASFTRVSSLALRVAAFPGSVPMMAATPEGGGGMEAVAASRVGLTWALEAAVA